jgi:hypothetical protein
VNVEHFYHICRSAASIANVREVTVFGSSAIVPWIERERPWAEFWPSMELDIDPGGEKLATLVDGSLGEGSLFEETFKVRAHGVSIAAFTAPADWPGRAGLFVEPASGTRIRAPHPLDLVVSKLTRGDPHDWAFAAFARKEFAIERGAVRAGLEAVARERPDLAASVAAALARLDSSP